MRRRKACDGSNPPSTPNAIPSSATPGRDRCSKLRWMVGASPWRRRRQRAEPRGSGLGPSPRSTAPGRWTKAGTGAGHGRVGPRRLAYDAQRHAGIVALGLHGSEPGNPPEPFAPAFRIGAEEAGLLSTPHAGEIESGPGDGAASVAGAIAALDANRVQHGVLAADDPALVDSLARDGISLDVCLSSNLSLGVYPSVEDHPLPRLLAAGAAVVDQWLNGGD